MKCSVELSGRCFGLEPNKQNCCNRDVTNGSERCFWHTKSKDETGKSTSMINAEIEKEGQNPTILDFADLSSSTIQAGVDFRHWLMRCANFTDSDLSGVNLSGANLSHSCLENTDLRGAQLDDSVLAGSILRNADLSNANLDGSLLMNADLSDSNLSSASLKNCSFARSNLTGADLTGANLSDSVFLRTEISEAKFANNKTTGMLLSKTHPWATSINGSVVTFHSQLTSELAELRQKGKILLNMFDRNILNSNSKINEPKSEEAVDSIAVLLCGLPRTFETTSDSVLERLSYANPDCEFDFFLNTSYQQSSDKNHKVDSVTENEFSSENELKQALYEAYDDHIVNIELLESTSASFPQILFNNNKNNFYSYRCYLELIRALQYENKNNKSYDLYVCMRFDVRLSKEIDISKFNNRRCLQFIPSKQNRPSEFHDRDFDFFCIGDLCAIKEWAKYWSYRPDIIPYFHNRITKDIELPSGFKGTWNWKLEQEEWHPHAYRLVANCLENGVDLDVRTAESEGVFAELIR